MTVIPMPVPTTAGAKAFEGDVAMLPIPELLQFLYISGRDGVLVISDGSGKPRAVIHYVGTSIVHATCDGILGREAVFAAIAFSTGHFEFSAGTPARFERTIDDNVQNLILEGLRRIDELAHVANLLPGDDAPLFVSPEPPQDDIRLTAMEWRILSLVNGKRTVRQIIDASARDEAGVRSILIGLLTADLVVAEHDDAYLDAIVPRRVRQDEAGETRYPPPTILANLLLKACDGKRPARTIMAELKLEERPFFEELRLLVRTHWVAFASGAEEFRRISEQ